MTLQGIVQQGQIQLTGPVDLPDGSRVFIVTDAPPLLAETVAQRRATRWLVEFVSMMLTALEARLLEVDDRPVWQFSVFITGRDHVPYGPIGYVQVDAYRGTILADESKVEQLMQKLLSVPYSHQLADGYCLAACAQMVLAFQNVDR